MRAIRAHAALHHPRPLLALLEQLKAIRRSVANNLNDIGKNHSGLLLDTARR